MGTTCVFSLNALLNMPDTLTTCTWAAAEHFSSSPLTLHVSLFSLRPSLLSSFSFLLNSPHWPRVRAQSHICAPYVKEDVPLLWNSCGAGLMPGENDTPHVALLKSDAYILSMMYIWVDSPQRHTLWILSMQEMPRFKLDKKWFMGREPTCSNVPKCIAPV